MTETDAAALVVSDQDGQELVNPIIDSIKDGNFSDGGNLDNWQQLQGLWELGWSDISGVDTFDTWGLPTKGDLIKIRNYLNTNPTLPESFTNLHNMHYWSSTHHHIDESAIILAPEIGDDMEGGVVFHVDEETNEALVVAKSDLGEYEWGCYGTSISGADGTVIGTGYQNTLDIEAGCPSGVAYDDWYLPSKDELVEMYNTIGGDDNIGGFASAWYWSSSEYNNNNAWSVSFSSGFAGLSVNKYYPRRVRVIRDANSFPANKVIGNYHEGGIIFYLTGDKFDFTCLIAPLEDLPGTYQWGCHGTNVSGAYGTSIGTGYQNTLDIVAGCSQTPIAASEALAYEKIDEITAAKACGDYSSGGYDDWYLPSKVELASVLTWNPTFSHPSLGVDGFNALVTSPGYPLYWSSSESYSTHAWAQISGPSGGGQTVTNVKYSELYVRPIRSFSFSAGAPLVEAWSVHMQNPGPNGDGSYKMEKSSVFPVRPIRYVTILVEDGIHSVGESIEGGVIYDRVVETVSGGINDGKEMQSLYIMANNDASINGFTLFNWGCVDVHNYTAANSFFIHSTNSILSACSDLFSAAAAAYGHAEEVSVSLNNTYGLIVGSLLVVHDDAIMRYVDVTSSNQHYTLRITVENMTEESGDLHIQTETIVSETAFRHDITYQEYEAAENSIFTYDFTELNHSSGKGNLFLSSVDATNVGGSGHFDGVITNIELIHRDVITNQTTPLTITFPEVVNSDSVIELDGSGYSETQILDLPAGWSFFSIWIDAETSNYTGEGATFKAADGVTHEANIITILKAQGDVEYDKIIIVKDYNGNALLPEWDFNGIGDFKNGYAYQIKTSEPCTLTFKGNPINTKEGQNYKYGMGNMPIRGGWWFFGIPFPPNPLQTDNEGEYDLPEIFSQQNTTPGNYDTPGQVLILKDTNGQAWLPEWQFDGIGPVVPGLGYQSKLVGDSQDLYYIDMTIEI